MKSVIDSVNQILTECREMINNAKDSEFMDIKGLSNTLENRCNELENHFNEHPEDTYTTNSLKRSVEHIAVRLEYFMHIRMHMYSDRVAKRNLVSALYADYKTTIESLYKDDMAQEGVHKLMQSYMLWLHKVTYLSTHICFELDDEDNKMLDNVIKALKEVSEKYGGQISCSYWMSGE